eukprot:582123-Rhodomonas_salina.1
MCFAGSDLTGRHRALLHPWRLFPPHPPPSPRIPRALPPPSLLLSHRVSVPVSRIMCASRSLF